MFYILFPLLILFVGLSLYSLLRGFWAFRNAALKPREEGDENQASEAQFLQNKMMSRRIKYQALAILIVTIMLGLANSGR